MNKEKRIPTILGLILLIGGIFAGVAFNNQELFLGSKASGDCKPINPQITNITHNSFDASFITTDTCLSNIVLGGKNIADIRFVNTNTEPTPSKIHYFQINNLDAETSYSFYFLNNGETFNSSLYQTKTARKPTVQIPSSNLAWGRVLNSDSKPAVDSIVYLNIPGASPLSSFVTSNGNWNISLAISFNDAKDDWFVSPKNIEEDVIVISQDGQATQITGNTSHNNPFPDIIIGRNSFSLVPANPESDSISNLNSVSQVSTNKNLEIKNPSEGESISTLKPDFFGTGPINSKIIIKIESTQSINDETTTQNDGSWHWSPPQNLTPGEHTITATAQNQTTGLVESVSRKFIVLASDNNNLAFSSSSSANLVTPTIILPSPTIISTPTPTVVEISPTSTPVVRAAKPSTSSGMPVAGGSLPTVIFTTIGILLFGAALIF